MPEGSEEQTEACWRLEERVVERYKDQKSTDNKKMRKELQEVSLKLSLANDRSYTTSGAAEPLPPLQLRGGGLRDLFC